MSLIGPRHESSILTADRPDEVPVAPAGFRVVGRSGPGTDSVGKWVVLARYDGEEGPDARRPWFVGKGSRPLRDLWDGGCYDILGPIEPRPPVQGAPAAIGVPWCPKCQGLHNYSDCPQIRPVAHDYPPCTGEYCQGAPADSIHACEGCGEVSEVDEYSVCGKCRRDEQGAPAAPLSARIFDAIKALRSALITRGDDGRLHSPSPAALEAVRAFRALAEEVADLEARLADQKRDLDTWAVYHENAEAQLASLQRALDEAKARAAGVGP